MRIDMINKITKIFFEQNINIMAAKRAIKFLIDIDGQDISRVYKIFNSLNTNELHNLIDLIKKWSYYDLSREIKASLILYAINYKGNNHILKSDILLSSNKSLLYSLLSFCSLHDFDDKSQVIVKEALDKHNNNLNDSNINSIIKEMENKYQIWVKENIYYIYRNKLKEATSINEYIDILKEYSQKYNFPLNALMFESNNYSSCNFTIDMLIYLIKILNARGCSYKFILNFVNNHAFDSKEEFSMIYWFIVSPDYFDLKDSEQIFGILEKQSIKNKMDLKARIKLAKLIQENIRERINQGITEHSALIGFMTNEQLITNNDFEKLIALAKKYDFNNVITGLIINELARQKDIEEKQDISIKIEKKYFSILKRTIQDDLYSKNDYNNFLKSLNDLSDQIGNIDITKEMLEIDEPNMGSSSTK